MPSALEVYEADPDYQATEALSLIPPPRMDPPSTQRNNFRDRDRGGFNRGGRGGGRFDNRGSDGRDQHRYQPFPPRNHHQQDRNASFGTQNRDDRNPHREPMGRRGHEEPKHEQREARGKVADHVQRFEWLANRDSKRISADDLVITIDKTQLPDYGLFCDKDMVSNLHSQKLRTSNLPPQNFQRGRSLSNPYENIGRSIFVNRSAVKMASIDRLMRHESTHGLIRGPEFTFADVCAGPGGFVEYVLWRCATQKVGVKGWGMTLKGEQDFEVEGFNDVSRRLVKGGAFEAKYGADGTGDITKPENVQAFRDIIMTGTDGKGVHLVMADGGFSCHGDELYQEFHTKKILTGQILAMFMSLREGGDFIIKTFDLFTPFTISLLYLLRASFHLFAITKPHTSRPANSERYVLCRGFTSIDRSVIVTHLEETLRKLMEVDPPVVGGQMSSHTEPPKGFVKVEERVGLGLLDVVEVVRREVVMADKDFVEYVENSNMKMCLKQTEALVMLEKLSAEGSTSPHDQQETRIRCLRDWSLPH